MFVDRETELDALNALLARPGAWTVDLAQLDQDLRDPAL